MPKARFARCRLNRLRSEKIRCSISRAKADTRSARLGSRIRVEVHLSQSIRPANPNLPLELRLRSLSVANATTSEYGVDTYPLSSFTVGHSTGIAPTDILNTSLY